ncbi:hypothetical protein [Wenjunlia tyrosinilytica]|jgi:hypothetical protein|uniref:Lipoprotein n=1 Tax=Wenjunlia tyrosinilytica TaxID=1544741 RepID=A0A917ZXS8_9ACTN|nr:hypothetical protein [Wenjunlia tyrosinilytica]GGO96138.1 lipoprotein [Wenjunlia tyrosinilytica]
MTQSHDDDADDGSPRAEGSGPAAGVPQEEWTGEGTAFEVWTGHATNRVQWLLAAAGAACLALGIDLAVDYGWTGWTGGLAPLVMSIAGCIAAGLLMLAGTVAFVHVRVRIDREGLEVRCGHIGLPRRRIAWAEVDSVSIAKVTPRQWGGWGYRWRPDRGTAVVVRRGPGVVLELGGGHRFTVTVDDAEGAVRAIQARLTPRSGAPGTA